MGQLDIFYCMASIGKTIEKNKACSCLVIEYKTLSKNVMEFTVIVVPMGCGTLTF